MQTASVKRMQRVQVRQPCPAGDMHDVGLPRHDAIDQRRITQTEKAMGPRIGRDIGNQLELVSLRERNIPGYALPETAVLNRCLTGMPGKEDLDRDLVAPAEALVQRGEVLNRMRND